MDQHSPISSYPTSRANATTTGTPRAFFGKGCELERDRSVQALSQLVRGVSAALMQLDWATVRHTTSIMQLLKAASEFDVTLVAINDEGLDYILQDFPDECGGAQ